MGSRKSYRWPGAGCPTSRAFRDVGTTTQFRYAGPNVGHSPRSLQSDRGEEPATLTVFPQLPCIFLGFMDSPRRGPFYEWSWRKAGQGLALLILVVAADWLIFGPRSARIQRETETLISSVPLPPETTQAKYESRHGTHKGSVIRTLVSKEAPQKLCDFYLPTFQQDGWIVQGEDCRAGAEHSLLSLRKGNVVCGVYVGYVDNAGNYYVYDIRMDWVD